MKRTITALGGLLIGAAPAFAGGIERAPQSLNVLFEKGNYAELSFGGASPDVKGRDIAGFETKNVASGYGFFGLAYKHQFNDNLSAAIIIEQPFGADINYKTPANGGSPVLGGTTVDVNSTTYTGILRYKFENNFSVHGGIRGSRADGNVTLHGQAYQAIGGYDLDIDGAWGVGWLAGVAYEVPELAARVSLTYNSPIEHNFNMTETSPAILAATGGLTDTVTGKHKVKTPRSWTLEGQTGVAEDTLVFGSIRWVKWSEFKVDNALFPIQTPLGPTELVSLNDTTTYTIGVGRKFTDNWSGSASFIYEPKKGDLISPLAPYNGRKGITLAAIYTQDNIKVTTGINYSKLGGSTLGVGPDAHKTQVAKTDNGDIWGIGVRVGYSF
ncbi:OmpP1/FadL family transporter [Paracoccus aminophilus]|uniref:Membrane protein n=1 Tax=Paracoccus aminophilus JCM 7686 TaxID=1367847 RepID=S5YWP0_PARAH|nr:outer membrane protein transport protein [Paracoccus aminophilus]AGT09611.1 membrane protein [Paracoccus aminophilus JCM 7686]